jgi:hypothetical protein
VTQFRTVEGRLLFGVSEVVDSLQDLGINILSQSIKPATLICCQAYRLAAFAFEQRVKATGFFVQFLDLFF